MQVSKTKRDTKKTKALDRRLKLASAQSPNYQKGMIRNMVEETALQTGSFPSSLPAAPALQSPARRAHKALSRNPQESRPDPIFLFTPLFPPN